MEQEIGKVTHFFDHISVAVISLTDSLKKGDAVRFVDEKRAIDFAQSVDRLELDHQEIEEAAAGKEAALKVTSPVKEGTKVFKVS